MKRVVYNSPAIEFLKIYSEGCLASSLGAGEVDFDGLTDLDEQNYEGFNW